MRRVPPSMVGSSTKAQLIENSGGVIVLSALPVARRFGGASGTPASAASGHLLRMRAVS